MNLHGFNANNRMHAFHFLKENPVKRRNLKVPKYLKISTRRWIELVLSDYELDIHHVKLLILAGEALDRCEQARKALALHGTIYLDKFGQPKARPEVAIERDSRISFARLLRELNLDALPEESRPPALKY